MERGWAAWELEEAMTKAEATPVASVANAKNLCINLCHTKDNTSEIGWFIFSLRQAQRPREK